MSLTPSRPSSFQLASDEVHSWCASLDVPPETSARLSATLTPDERTRSARFHFERDQQRFIVARGVLRDLVGRYLQTQPSQIRFVYNAFGKPDLSPEFGNRLKFNLRSEEHTSELQSRLHLVCRLLLEKKKKQQNHLQKHTNRISYPMFV